MNILLDTHMFIWCASDPERLPAGARNLILNSEPQIYVSAASVWKMAVKASIGRLESGFDLLSFDGILARNGYAPLPVSVRHAALVASLPLHRNDLFDRLLVSQALSEPSIC